MVIGPLIGLASNFVQSLITGPLTAAASVGSKTTTTSSTTGIGASGGVQDSQRLSPFAQILGSLQQLQQSSPAQYQQVTQQISTNLQGAAQSATTQGNTSLAANLTQLSKDFGTASGSGQLPNVTDLAKAVHGHGHHGGHHRAQGADPDGDGSNTAATSTSAANVSQLFQSLGSTQSGAGGNSLDPLNIIFNSLQSAGLQVG